MRKIPDVGKYSCWRKLLKVAVVKLGKPGWGARRPRDAGTGMPRLRGQLRDESKELGAAVAEKGPTSLLPAKHIHIYLLALWPLRLLGGNTRFIRTQLGNY